MLTAEAAEKATAAKVDAVLLFEDLLTNHSATVAKLRCLG